MKRRHLLAALIAPLFVSAARADEGKHLFILSGQSNMVGLNPKVSFTPTVEKAFGANMVIVIKSAKSGQPIRRWCKEWKPAKGRAVSGSYKPGDLYDKMMGLVKPAIKDQKIASVTLVWMQGERDAREQHGEVYAESFSGIIGQLEKDLDRDDVNFVIGRLSDMDMENKRYPHWTMVREQQVKIAEAAARGGWVDTDDLPMKGDNLHYHAEGFKTLGRRFADKAVELIRAY